MRSRSPRSSRIASRRSGAPTSPPSARFARTYARDTGTRVVVVDARGSALADTASPRSGERSFASRPEIRQALRGIVAQGSRPSRTLRQTLLFVAVPVASGGHVRGAVRVSYPTATADARARRAWETLGAIAAVVLLIAVVLGVVLARIVRRPLESLTAAATAVGAGDLSARSEVTGPPETRAVASAFNLMAARLDELLRAQQSFAADAAHELRSPLQALRLRLENLEDEVAPGGRRDLEAAHAEALRLSRLVTGLLELAVPRTRPSRMPRSSSHPPSPGGSGAGASSQPTPASTSRSPCRATCACSRRAIGSSRWWRT